MTVDGEDPGPPADRRSPVGRPVIRGDAAIAGERAEEAVEFDPDDSESVALAVETIRAFAAGDIGDGDPIYMLRGAAACAALVRAEGSYKAARERIGGDATVTFIRKWARVHDLPRAIRIHVAMGNIAPTAAKHIARVSGDARYHLAWATIDHGMTVRDVRAIASDVNNGMDVAVALEANGVTPGRLSLSLPLHLYRELRRRSAIEGTDPDAIVAAALDDRFELDS